MRRFFTLTNSVTPWRRPANLRQRETSTALAALPTACDHELAGNLLRRVGEEEQALAEYQLAAAQLIASGQGHYQAGELMLTLARRPDLALPYYEDGWSLRSRIGFQPVQFRADRLETYSPTTGGMPCLALSASAQIHAHNENVDQLLAVTAAAETFLSISGNDRPATEFYHELARLADQPALTSIRDDLRNRAIMGIALKIRQRHLQQPNAGDIVSAMLGRASLWASRPLSAMLSMPCSRL